MHFGRGRTGRDHQPLTVDRWRTEADVIPARADRLTKRVLIFPVATGLPSKVTGESLKYGVDATQPRQVAGTQERRGMFSDAEKGIWPPQTTMIRTAPDKPGGNHQAIGCPDDGQCRSRIPRATAHAREGSGRDSVAPGPHSKTRDGQVALFPFQGAMEWSRRDGLSNADQRSCRRSSLVRSSPGAD